MKLQVLFEDNHVIAVVKPAGLLVQGDKTGDTCLLDIVKKYLKEKYNKPGNVFLGLVHRLDRPVAGIVILGKTSKGAARLSEQFRTHSIQKIYHAVVQGRLPQKSGTLKSFLQKDREKNRTEVYDEEGDDRQAAELDYEVIKTGKDCSLVKIILKTGRSHQIRAQLAAEKCPIVGDVKYGASKPLPDGSIALAATSLTFQLATKNESQTVSMDLPKEWDIFLK
ncbi:MAG: hypothetical protein A2Z88_00620 [Omnitrophica WOR_2 bacterium GWA2_47_8]|nr:MAG: hypothetical protein A2Z88_00620 [Omnitrophica WOR_2 bacterium GWA2_47_8]